MADKRINLEIIPKEKFALAGENRRISDTKFETKPVGYFKDAFNRFKKNKSSLVAAIIILLLFKHSGYHHKRTHEVTSELL